MDLFFFIRFGYFILIGTLVLMIWVSLIESREIELVRYPPCYFNPLCSCSKASPDLGIVRCHDIHLPRIPETVNVSKVFMLHLENTNLRTIDPYFLQSTGLYKIAITKNPLSIISEEAFIGLERSLWELDLSYNQLTQVPNRAIRYLQKLRSLDLRGNDIVKISAENWRGLENTLTSLILSDNSIFNLPTDLFSGLPMVETINLKGNNLKEIDPSVFRDGMGKLTTLILADNQLSAIPYQSLSYLKALKTLDLSYNRITKLQPAMEVGVQNVNYNFQINLDIIRLDYNQIIELEPAAFQYFNVLNKTYLDGNPIGSVQDNAFRNAKIRELYLRNCGLKTLSPVALSGLENYLEVLDLSSNKIQEVTDDNFHRFENLRTLALRDNLLVKFNPIAAFNGFQFTLYRLDLSGSENMPILIQDLRRLRNLRVLSISRSTKNTLSPEDFAEFGIDLDELEITQAGLKTIKDNSFKHIHGLRRLQLTDNQIATIEPKAFTDIGHSLVYLSLANALSSSLNKIPADAIKTLLSIEELNLSNNKIKVLLDTSFHFLKKLKILHLQDNTIEQIYKGTFQGDIHDDLLEINLSFNLIKTITQHSFVDLAKLEQLHLDDNRIESLERRAFMNLESLKRLNLKGNNIKSVAFESFQNLPELENLDLSYNNLPLLDFTVFDQVGTLSMFHVNVSHNKLDRLFINSSLSFDQQISPGGIHSNIKVLDLSFNNITFISNQFFRPVELSLSHLHLSHNQLLNATKDVFGNMPHLQMLDLSHNFIYDFDYDTFRYTKKLQIFLATNNRLAEIPGDLFRFLSNLRIVDFSHNRLRALPDNLFREAGIERLDVSHNFIGKLPLGSLSVASAMTLCELDLSWNSIASLVHGGLLTRFKSLSFLDLSYNRLAQIDAGTFKGLPRLSSLNLGHNLQLSLEITGLSLQGLEFSLLHLNLDNMSLSQVPALRTTNLITLSLANNALPTVSAEMALNISKLRDLNLSNNDLSAVPIVTHSLNELRYLSMANNPISTLTNTSLLGVAQTLKELDLRHIEVASFENGALCKLQALRTLKIDLYKNVKNFNVPRILQYSSGLKNLEIHIAKEVPAFEHFLMGDFPVKLQNLTFSGKGLTKLTSKTLQGVHYPSFHFNLRNTSVTKLALDLFENLGNGVKNITIDVRNNPSLKTLLNPSTGPKPNLHRSTFLTDLRLTGGKWACDCDLGWVEVWQRKKRQYICNSEPSSLDDSCEHTDDDLRTALCTNKNNRSVIDVLKTEIECGWSDGTKFDLNFVLFALLLAWFFV